MYNPYRHLSHQFLTMVEALESGSMPPVKFLPEPDPARRRNWRLRPRSWSRSPRKLHRDFPRDQRQETGAGLPERRHPADTRLAAGELPPAMQDLVDEAMPVALTA